MSGNNASSFIEIDDDDSNPIAFASQPRPIASGVGISSSVFPKLHSMLQRRKVKSEEENKTFEACQVVPQVIQSASNQKEVYQVVPILPHDRQLASARATNQTSNPKNTESNEPEERLLLVEEAFEPLAARQPPIMQAFPNVIADEQVNKSESEAASFIKLIDQAQIARAQPGPSEMLLFTEENPVASEPIRQFQSIYPPEITSSFEAPLFPQSGPARIQEIQQIQSHPSEAVNQIPVLVTNQEEKLGEIVTVVEGLTFPQIKRILMSMLPDMSSSIQTMSNQDLIKIYISVKAELPENQLQALIKESLEQTFNFMEVEASSQRPESCPPQEKEVAPFQIDGLINQNWTEIETLKFFKTLPFERLRAAMKKYFHYEDDQFNKIEQAGLLGILNQAILEFENKQDNQKVDQVASNPQPVQPTVEAQDLATRDVQPVAEDSIAGMKELSQAEMRSFLLENIPSVRPQQLQNIANDYIVMLYEGVTNGRLSRVEIAQKIQEKSHSIREKCIQKFPRLQSSLSKITEEELSTLMVSLVNFNRDANKARELPADEVKPSPPAFESKATSVNIPPKYTQEDDEIIQEMSRKRTHDVMLSANPCRTQEIKSDSRRRKAGELRQKLLQRLPDLRQNIMKLDDSQIEKIYQDSMQKNRQSYTNKMKSRESEGRPVIIMKDKKVAEASNIPESTCEGLKQRTETVVESPFQNGKIVQINSEQKKKKSRTIILVHREQQQPEGEAGSFKIKKTENGIEKKSCCDCFSNVSVGQLLKKLGELIDKKN